MEKKSWEGIVSFLCGYWWVLLIVIVIIIGLVIFLRM